VLSDGTKVSGAIDLRQALLQRPEVLVGTMTEKLLTYALGRVLEPHDQAFVRAIVRDAAPGHYKFSALVKGVVTSTPFKLRKKES
jgi:hypothetical protein